MRIRHQATAGLTGEPPTPEGLSIGELLRRLVMETGRLIRHELTLARLELRDSARAAARNAILAGIGAGLLGAGAMAFLACLILALGAALDGAYWAAALIIGVVLSLAGLIVGRRYGKRLLSEPPAPREAARMLQADARWAAHRAKEVRNDVVS